MPDKLALDVLNELDGTDPSHLPSHYVEALEFSKRFPNLYDLLFRRRLNEKDRLGGSMSLFMDGDVLKVGVFLKTEGRRAFETISDPYQVFSHLERKLASKGLDWRPLKESKWRKNPTLR